MASRNATNRGGNAFQSRSKQHDWADGILPAGDPSILFTDHRFHIRPVSPSEENSSFRSLSILEDLLRHVAGDRAHVMASRLLIKFGSLSRVMHASQQAIEVALQGEESVAAAICAARMLAETASSERLVGERIDLQSPAFKSYLKSRLCNHHEERLLVVYLTQGGRFIGEEVFQNGMVDGIRIRARPIMQRAFEFSAHQLLIAHNHPSGDARPSEMDYKATGCLETISLAVEISIFDHLIEGDGKFYSMKHRSLLV